MNPCCPVCFLLFRVSESGGRRTHAAQPSEMRSEPRAEGDVFSVFHSKFSTRLFYDFGEGWVVDVAYSRKEVVFDLKVQAAKEPALHPAAARKVHSGFHLMYRPGIF